MEGAKTVLAKALGVWVLFVFPSPWLPQEFGQVDATAEPDLASKYEVRCATVKDPMVELKHLSSQNSDMFLLIFFCFNFSNFHLIWSLLHIWCLIFSSRKFTAGISLSKSPNKKNTFISTLHMVSVYIYIYIYLKIDIRRHRHKCKLDIQGFISLSLLDSWLGYVVSDIEVLREWRWQIWVLNHCLYTPTTWKSKLSKQRHLLGWNGSPQNFRILAWNQSIFISNFFWDSAGDPIEYDGPRDADGIAEWLRSFGQQWRRVETMIKEKKEKNSRIMGRPSPN